MEREHIIGFIFLLLFLYSKNNSYFLFFLHRWIGFSPETIICNICEHCPGEYLCNECNSAIYCRACCKVFHHKGRKRKHQITLYKEEINETFDTYCKECNRRKGTINCFHCLNLFCNSCYECKHQSNCDGEKKLIPTNQNNVNNNNNVNNSSSSNNNNLKFCVECNEIADKQCIECGDFYCSRSWMGNPGCFEKYHSKGNRINHQIRMINK